MLDLAETVQKAVEGERWPPVQKAVEECVHYAVFQPYLDRLDFEVDPLLYPFDDAPPLHLYQKFLKQVRESRGLLFSPVASSIVEEDETFKKYDVPECKDLVCKINNKAKEHGKFYVFDEIKIAVGVSGFTYMLLTFTVREVSSNKLERVRVCYWRDTIVQWSFKREDEEEDRVIYTMPAE